MNKYQKRTIITGLLIIAAAVAVWLASGGEIFTKTQVLIEKKDALFGTTYKELKDKFIFGLLPSGFSFALASLAVTSLSGIVIVLSGFLFFIFKKKGRNETSI
ncbi:MAG: hypothetical protein WCE54_23470 [Ignavibacteriaceae bacterium]